MIKIGDIFIVTFKDHKYWSGHTVEVTRIDINDCVHCKRIDLPNGDKAVEGNWGGTKEFFKYMRPYSKTYNILSNL